MAQSLKKQIPLSRDAEATKNSILDAAEEEFAKGGLLGAGTEAIAAKTGVTKCMIFYHFGSKEGLYRAVLERAVSHYVRAMQAVDIHSGEPQEALRNVLEVFLDLVPTRVNMHSILVYEGIQNKGKFFGQVAFASIHEPLLRVLKRGMETGQFRKLNPLHAAVNIIGMCVFYFSHRENVKHFWPQGANPLSKEMVAEHKKQAIEQAMAGVLACPPASQT
jgi:TetR/AcrR family transcriptional regulator